MNFFTFVRGGLAALYLFSDAAQADSLARGLYAPLQGPDAPKSRQLPNQFNGVQAVHMSRDVDTEDAFRVALHSITTVVDNHGEIQDCLLATGSHPLFDNEGSWDDEYRKVFRPISRSAENMAWLGSDVRSFRGPLSPVLPVYSANLQVLAPGLFQLVSADGSDARTYIQYADKNRRDRREREVSNCPSILPRPLTNSELPPPAQPSPLIIDFTGGGFEFVGESSAVDFDVDGDGSTARTSWPRGGGLAFLVLDRDQNRRIETGGELFGVGTYGADGRKFDNGFDALATWDLDQNGVIDEHDPIFKYLALWFDRDSDGRTSIGELETLQQRHVEAIGLRWTRSTARVDEIGNKLLGTSSVQLSDGARAIIGDWVFKEF